MLLGADLDEAAGAAPPAVVQGVRVAARPPLAVALGAAPQEVFVVVLAQVISEMVLPVEGRRVPGAFGVVAQVPLLLVVGEVHRREMPVEVGLSAGHVVAPAVGASELFFF